MYTRPGDEGRGAGTMTQDAKGRKDGSPPVLDLEEPGGRPAAPRAAAGGGPDLAALLRMGERWGYVDDDGAIHVRAGRYTADRIVARVPPSKRADTLANLLLRFAELEDRFASLLEEIGRSRNATRNLKSLQSFVHWVEGAEAIGDYDSLLGRAHAEIEKIERRLAEGRAAKEALVERAEALAGSTDWRSTAELMDELMEEWKAAGSAGREHDEELWQRFKKARSTFFARRKRHFADLRKSRAEARERKEALIERAAELAPSTDYEATFAAMQELLEEWKRAGSAGRDVDDRLWERFHAARDPFFERRKAYLAEQRRRSPGGPRRQGQRRREGRSSQAKPGGRRHGGATGPLRSSLADLVGPLKDLFPAERHDEEDGSPPGKGEKGPGGNG